MITAEIKRLHSPDVFDLATYVPLDSNKFCFLLQIIAGPVGQDGEESFDVMVCTPGWLAEKISPTEPLIGRHHLIVLQYQHENLRRFLLDYCATCEGDTWQQVAEKLGRIGHWEFEDYHRRR